MPSVTTQTSYFEVFKLLYESIQHDESRRESMNQVWLVINSFGLTFIKQFNDVASGDGHSNSEIYMILCLVGCLVAFGWFFSLRAIKHKLEVKHSRLIDLEKELDGAIFGDAKFEKILGCREKIVGYAEISVPVVFFLAYLSLLVIAGLH